MSFRLAEADTALQRDHRSSVVRREQDERERISPVCLLTCSGSTCRALGFAGTLCGGNTILYRLPLVLLYGWAQWKSALNVAQSQGGSKGVPALRVVTRSAEIPGKDFIADIVSSAWGYSMTRGEGSVLCACIGGVL